MNNPVANIKKEIEIGNMARYVMDFLHSDSKSIENMELFLRTLKSNLEQYYKEDPDFIIAFHLKDTTNGYREFLAKFNFEELRLGVEDEKISSGWHFIFSGLNGQAECIIKLTFNKEDEQSFTMFYNDYLRESIQNSAQSIFSKNNSILSVMWTKCFDAIRFVLGKYAIYRVTASNCRSDYYYDVDDENHRTIVFVNTLVPIEDPNNYYSDHGSIMIYANDVYHNSRIRIN